MKKITEARHFKLIREDTEAEVSHEMYFAADESVIDYKAAIRATVDDFLRSSMAREPHRTSYCWEQLLCKIPDELWGKHGLKMVDDIPFVLVDDMELFPVGK